MAGETLKKNATITLKNVTKVFPNGYMAVKDFSLDIANGEELVIVGPSGCGKSTVLRMIAGLEEVSEGEILIDGKRVNELSVQERDVAMIFQNGVLYLDKTVAENLSFGLEMRHEPKEEIERALRETAELLEITDLLDLMPSALTEQQKQLVLVGRALVKERKVYLLDDPLSNFDETVRRKARKGMVEIHKKSSRTVVYVTENQEEAMEIGTRIVVMKDGAIQQVGTPEEIYRHPANMFVARYIGASAMNMLDAQVEQEEGHAVLVMGVYRQTLSPEMSKVLLDSDYVGKKVVVGIRPEDIYGGNKTGAERAGTGMEGVVQIYEQPREEVSLHFKVKDATLTVMTSPETKVRPGDKVYIFPDMNRIHIFDKATEAAIL